jgi:hypothetical protein
MLGKVSAKTQPCKFVTNVDESSLTTSSCILRGSIFFHPREGSTVTDHRDSLNWSLPSWRYETPHFQDESNSFTIPTVSWLLPQATESRRQDLSRERENGSINIRTLPHAHMHHTRPES